MTQYGNTDNMGFCDQSLRSRIMEVILGWIPQNDISLGCNWDGRGHKQKDSLLSELLNAPGFKDLSTTGGLAGLTVVLQSEGCVDATGAVGDTSREGFSKSGTSGPPRPGSTFPNSCTIFSRSFSSSWFRIISSKAWNCSCSNCCCFCCATLCLSFSSSCWMVTFRENSSASFFYKERIGVRLTLHLSESIP